MPVPHQRIQEILFTRPHLIQPSYLSSILAGLGERVGIDAKSFIKAMEDDDLSSFGSGSVEEEVQVPNSIALIQVHGVLVHRGGWLEGCGIRSYEAIRADVEEALSNSNVSAILLDIDSGGGECSGLFDLADWLIEAGKSKPIYAFAHDYAFSAAYAIASCAQKLYVAQAGEVGSIGVVAVHYDVSEADQKAGVKVTPIYAGAKKVDGWAHGPLSDRALTDFQYSIDATYQKFVSLVSRARGLNEDFVRGTEAGCFIAADAVANGLADKIANFDEVINEIFVEISTRNGSGLSALNNSTATQKGNNMPIKLFGRSKKAEDTPAENEDDKKPQNEPEDDAPEEDMEEDSVDHSADEDSASEDAPEDESEDDGEDDPETTAKASGYAEAMAVVELAALAGKSTRSALKMLEKGMTADEARRSLVAQQKTSPKSDVLGQHKGSTVEDTNRMAEKMRANFEKKGK